MSCGKAQKYFEENGISVEQISDARKEKIDADQAWDMVKGQSQVFIGKGKKILEFTPDEANREDILKSAMGRSGNLRAPTVKTGGKVLIGFNEDIYTRL
ncbi:MAG: hypothetical protein MI892_24500 [Desulfobacterales bacterium]|nr:hypothetical protein [Desulfobacterales bacterium]